MNAEPTKGDSGSAFGWVRPARSMADAVHRLPSWIAWVWQRRPMWLVDGCGLALATLISSFLANLATGSVTPAESLLVVAVWVCILAMPCAGWKLYSAGPAAGYIRYWQKNLLRALLLVSAVWSAAIAAEMTTAALLESIPSSQTVSRYAEIAIAAGYGVGAVMLVLLLTAAWAGCTWVARRQLQGRWAAVLVARLAWMGFIVLMAIVAMFWASPGPNGAWPASSALVAIVIYAGVCLLYAPKARCWAPALTQPLTILLPASQTSAAARRLVNVITTGWRRGPITLLVRPMTASGWCGLHAEIAAQAGIPSVIRPRSHADVQRWSRSLPAPDDWPALPVRQCSAEPELWPQILARLRSIESVHPARVLVLLESSGDAGSLEPLHDVLDPDHTWVLRSNAAAATPLPFRARACAATERADVMALFSDPVERVWIQASADIDPRLARRLEERLVSVLGRRVVAFQNSLPQSAGRGIRAKMANVRLLLVLLGPAQTGAPSGDLARANERDQLTHRALEFGIPVLPVLVGKLAPNLHAGWFAGIGGGLAAVEPLRIAANDRWPLDHGWRALIDRVEYELGGAAPRVWHRMTRAVKGWARLLLRAAAALTAATLLVTVVGPAIRRERVAETPPPALTPTPTLPPESAPR